MKKINNNDIPKLPHRFFSWYCKKEMYEELHGDLEEFFYERVKEKGLFKAKLLYTWDVIRCCQSYAVRKPKTQNTTIMMFNNYYKTSKRSLMKNPLSSFINLIGLSVAIGICIVAYSFNQYMRKIDQFHEFKDEVFLVTFYADREGELQQNGQSPRPLAGMLKDDFEQVKKVSRIEDGNVVLKHGKYKVFNERIRYADPEFLEMLSFPLKWGESKSLHDKNGIIMSEEMSKKYFGEEYSIGKNIEIIFGDNNKKVFEVTGVFEEFPGANSIYFDLLVNFENIAIAQPEYDLYDWSYLMRATLIQLTNPNDRLSIEASMDKYRILQNHADPNWVIESFALEPINTLYQNSENIRGDISSNGYGAIYKSSIAFVVIGVFVLALASINYINIAVVTASKRLKEIGLRKVIGANRLMVISQFLGENVLIMFIALITGTTLGTFVFTPWMEQSSNFDMDFTLYDPKLLILLPLILLTTAVASGIYPALYISKFQVASIFKGSFKIGKGSFLTKIFLGFQITMACILISLAVMFTQNSIYQSEREWGYDNTDVIYAELPDHTYFEQFYNAMNPHGNVETISGSIHHLAKKSVNTIVEEGINKYEVQQLEVDSNYFETMGLQLVAGRDFEGSFASDEKAIIINETLASSLSSVKPLGKWLTIDSAEFEIVGIVKDFHVYNFDYRIRPLIFRLAYQDNFKFIAIKAQEGKGHKIHEALRDTWATLLPELPFNGGYQEDSWGSYYESLASGGRFWRALAFMVLILSGLGLYGLVSLNASGRTKEFSVRKILGAKLENIAFCISKEYTVIFVISMMLGIPLSYFLVESLFKMFFTYHMPMNFAFTLFSGSILVLVLAGIFISQIRKVTKSSLTDGLKVE